MVKGISKRVVVVQPEDSAVFEQAIFIVRDGERQDVLKEAREVAERYLRRGKLRPGGSGNGEPVHADWRGH